MPDAAAGSALLLHLRLEHVPPAALEVLADLARSADGLRAASLA
ncbi:hypothetical protein [Mycobacterium sp. URHB0044]|nr:hypothetical protein [Mycobacterium sp. URHB0044]